MSSAADDLLALLDATFAADDAVMAEEAAKEAEATRKAHAAAELEYQLAREDIAMRAYERKLRAACHGRIVLTTL